MIRSKSYLIVGILLGLTLIAAWSLRPANEKSQAPTSAIAYNIPELPIIPEEATPKTGSVTERWPDGELKSKRIYRDGEIISAVYYASNGIPVYKMSTSEAQVAKLGDEGN